MVKAKSHQPSDIRLRWVIPDPSNERAADPLGMGAQADKIAHFLLPQISVATTRARYFSFLCWAVQESKSAAAPLPEIRRLEAKLALDEAVRHQDEDSRSCPNVVGRRTVADYLKRNDGEAPARPERLYKSTAFATYRPAMRTLGLLSHERKPELTDEGRRLAAEFARFCGRKLPCLCDMSSKERTRVSVLLGLDERKQDNVPSECLRRRATFKVLRQLLDDNDAASVLEEFSENKKRGDAVTAALHCAFVWELLSTGLALAFSMLLEKKRMKPLANLLRQALRNRPRRPPLGPLSPGRDEAAGDVVALLRAAIKFHPERLKLDPSPFQIAILLVDKRKPIEFLQHLVERHHLAKPDAPWIRLNGDKVHVLAPQKSLAFPVRPRSYRIDAFKQLLRDLGRIR